MASVQSKNPVTLRRNGPRGKAGTAWIGEALALLEKKRAQLAKIERLGQVMIEPGLESDFVIVVGIARGERNCLDVGIQVLRFGDDLEAVAVRQAEIAQKDVDGFLNE